MIDANIFIKTLICTILMFSCLVIMITLKFKYQHPYIHVLSFGGLLLLLSGFFFIFDMTTFNLDNYNFYGLWSKVFFLSGFFLILVTLMIVKKKYKNNLRSVFKKIDYKNIFYNLEVLTIITDVDGKILLINDHDLFEETFDKNSDYLENDIFKELIMDSQRTRIYKKKDQSLLVMMSMIKSRTALLGYLFSLDDITGLETQKDILKKQNSALESMNIVLEETIDIKSKLSVEKERLKVLNRIQNDLVSHIEHIILNLEIKEDKPLEAYQEKAESTALELRKVYKSIREVIREMKGESDE